VEEVLRPKGHEWNVDFIAAICTFYLQKALDLEKFVENFIKEKTNYEAVFIPWKEKPSLPENEKPILLKNEDGTKFSNFDFEDIKKDVKEKKLNEKYKLFIAAIGSEKISLDPSYLSAKKFVRIKRPGVEIQFTSEPLNQLGKMVAEVHLLVHKTGIIVVTLYIRPPSGKTLDTYQIIEIERRLQDEKVKMNDGSEDKLEDYLLNNVLKELFKELFLNELKKYVNIRYVGIRYAVCIRSYSYYINFEHTTHEEFYGILNAMRGWYLLDESKIKLKELYKRRDFHIFAGSSGSLFFGFDEFEKNVEESNKIFEKKPDYYGKLYFLYTFPEYFEHYVVTPMEFLSIIDSIAERYFNRIQDVSKNYWKSSKFIKEIFEDSQECNNIAFMRARLIWRIVRYEEKNLEISEKMEVIKDGISTLTSTVQQDAQIRNAIIFGIINSLLAGELVWDMFHNPGLTEVCMLLLLLLIIKFVGIRATVYTLKNAIISVTHEEIRGWMNDAYLILKTIIDTKFKRPLIKLKDKLLKLL
jgi:hypothetical protein